jgi:hypothetical protein
MALDNLSFLDLLYAVPVGDLAVRVSGSSLGDVSSGDWGALAVCLVVIVTSWVGLHQNRVAMEANVELRDSISKMHFLSARFVQFLLEVAIIGMYFALGLTIKLPDTPTPNPPVPSETWLAGFLLLIFMTYLAWDLLDIWLARKHDIWRSTASRGGGVTLGFTVLFLIMWIVVHEDTPSSPHGVLWWSLVAIGLLYLYRVVQQKVIGPLPEAQAVPCCCRPKPEQGAAA